LNRAIGINIVLDEMRILNVVNVTGSMPYWKAKVSKMPIVPHIIDAATIRMYPYASFMVSE
jgi:hypothetical protein